MTPPNACLNEELLLMIASEGSSGLDPSSQKHLADCARCRQNVEQIDRELRALQTFYDDAMSIELASVATVARDNGDSSPVRNSRLPAAIGRYQVVGEMPRSGQAEVYRVLHPELHMELVAKVSKIDPNNPSDNQTNRRLLMEEARTLKELDHPNIARIVDLGTEGDHVYLVMEYVRGANLRQYLKNRQLMPLEAAQWILQIAEGLAPAHAHGIVHGDMKPANVIVDPQGRPRIIDFGLARFQDAWRGQQGINSRVGGTPAYLSPEQACGDCDAISPATDVFSMGAMLFQMLTGRGLYDEDNVETVIERAKEGRFDRLLLNKRSIPAGLKSVCLKSLNVEPSQRYPDARAMADAIRRLIDRRSFLRVAMFGLGGGVTLAGSFGLLLRYWPLHRQELPLEPHEMVYVERGPVRFVNSELPGPLTSDDFVQIKYSVHPTARISPDWGAEFVRFDTQGILRTEDEPLQLLDNPEKPGHFEVRWPSTEMTQLGGISGTELLVVCGGSQWANKRESVLEQFEQQLGSQPLPPLPENLVVRFSRDKVTVVLKAWDPRGPVELRRESAEVIVRDRLDQLRRALGESCVFLNGEAFYRLDKS